MKERFARWQRACALTVCLCMVFSFVPVHALEEYEAEEQGTILELLDGTEAEGALTAVEGLAAEGVEMSVVEEKAQESGMIDGESSVEMLNEMVEPEEAPAEDTEEAFAEEVELEEPSEEEGEEVLAKEVETEEPSEDVSEEAPTTDTSTIVETIESSQILVSADAENGFELTVLTENLDDTEQETPECPHPETATQWVTSTVGPTYTVVDDKQHLVCGYVQTYCTTCVAFIGEITYVEENEEHSFNAAGDCTLCGYRASCPHENEEYVLIDGFPNYEQYSNKMHIVEKQYKAVCSNPTCGAVVRDIVPEKRTREQEKHEFDANGTCDKCGYTKKENQDELSVIVARGQTSAMAGSIITAEASANGGSGSYQYCWYVYLDGKEVASLELGESTSFSYKADEIGTYSFYVSVRDSEGNEVSGSSIDIRVNPATCEHNEIVVRSKTDGYESLSDSRHQKNILVREFCDNCGEEVSRYYKQKIEAHSFDEGKCRYCGLADSSSACPHTNATPELTSSTISAEGMTAEYHVLENIYTLMCDECGEPVNTRSERLKEKHTFNGQGICACGYAKPTQACDHADRSIVEIATDGYPQYETNDEKYHVKKVICQSVCNTCGTPTANPEEKESMEAHSYINGICVCGKQEHIHDYEEIIVSREICVNLNVTQHTVDVTSYEKCKVCGDTTEEKTQTVYEDHVFTGKMHIEALHQNKGHAQFKKCVCGAAKYTGIYAELKGCAQCVVSPTECQHVFDSGIRQKAHPHYLKKTCQNCGFTVEDQRAISKGYMEECCECSGHLFRDEIYDVCLRCGEKFNICLHEKTHFTAHPHYDVVCDLCNETLADQSRPNGRKLISCSYCYPNENFSAERANEVIKYALAAYRSQATTDNDKIIEIIKDSVQVDSGLVEAQITVERRDDGGIELIISFEGSVDFDDWVIVDADAVQDENGIHKGVSKAVDEFMWKYLFEGDAAIDVISLQGTAYGDQLLKQLEQGGRKEVHLMDLVRRVNEKDSDVHLTITGHSLGGGLAQVLLYKLVNEKHIQKNGLENVEVYTYASLIPFSKQTLKDDIFRHANVYNIINTQDYVTDVGVTNAETIGIVLVETIGNLIRNGREDILDGGKTAAGINWGTNIYLKPTNQKWSFNSHSMELSYIPLVEAWANHDPSVEWMSLDTNIMYTDYYSGKQDEWVKAVTKNGEKLIEFVKGMNEEGLLDSLDDLSGVNPDELVNELAEELVNELAEKLVNDENAGVLLKFLDDASEEEVLALLMGMYDEELMTIILR